MAKLLNKFYYSVNAEFKLSHILIILAITKIDFVDR